jgi:hypothetical protein
MAVLARPLEDRRNIFGEGNCEIRSERNRTRE